MNLEELIMEYVPPFFESLYCDDKLDLHYSYEGKSVVLEFNKDYNEIKNNFEKKILKFATSSKKNFVEFFNYIRNAWRIYLNLSYSMFLFRNCLHDLYPKKIEIFKDLIDKTYKLNVMLYFLTDIEKEVYESVIEKYLPEERSLRLIESIKSLPLYLSNKIPKFIENTKNPFEISYYLLKNKEFRDIFNLFGSSIKITGLLLDRPILNKSIKEKQEFIPKDDFEKSLVGLITFDHFFEVFLRQSRILMNDLKFYVDISNRLSCKKDINAIISRLDELLIKRKTKFKHRIKRYTQKYLSCGAACLINVISAYNPQIILNESLEKSILSKITTKGFPNNIPSSIAYLSNSELGIPAYFFSDEKTFNKIFLSEKATKEPLKKFQEDYYKLREKVLDYSNISPNEIIDKLQKGYLISFVSGDYPHSLHYKLIFGYELKNKKDLSFFIFDPIVGVSKVNGNEILRYIRNSLSMWGIEFRPPENVIFDWVLENLNKSKELLKWKNIIII